MNRILALVVLISFAFASSAIAAPYWPSPPDGTVYTYEDSNGDVREVVYGTSGTTQTRQILWFDGQCTETQTISVSVTEALLQSSWSYCNGNIDPTEYLFDPALQLAWDGMAAGGGIVVGDPLEYVIAVEAAVVQTGMGPLDTLHLVFIGADPLPPVFDVYLHETYGPVKEGDYVLQSVDHPVAVESPTWSSLKSRF